MPLLKTSKAENAEVDSSQQIQAVSMPGMSKELHLVDYLQDEKRVNILIYIYRSLRLIATAIGVLGAAAMPRAVGRA